MENIIFLDIDGVLNDNNCLFLKESVETLKLLIKRYNAKVVIISSWQMNGTESRRKRIKKQFEELCIYNIDFIDPNLEGNLGDIKLPPRLLGIVDYLKNNKVENYIKITAKEDSDKIVLSILDNGIVIEKADLSRVFEKTFTGSNGRIVTSSTGMGLYIVNKLCQKLGHVISIDSEINNYTCVNITFFKNDFYNLQS